MEEVRRRTCLSIDRGREAALLPRLIKAGANPRSYDPTGVGLIFFIFLGGRGSWIELLLPSRPSLSSDVDRASLRPGPTSVGNVALFFGEKMNVCFHFSLKVLFFLK